MVAFTVDTLYSLWVDWQDHACSLGVAHKSATRVQYSDKWNEPDDTCAVSRSSYTAIAYSCIHHSIHAITRYRQFDIEYGYEVQGYSTGVCLSNYT